MPQLLRVASSLTALLCCTFAVDPLPAQSGVRTWGQQVIDTAWCGATDYVQVAAGGYQQALVVDPAAGNAFGAVLSNAAAAVVGN